MISDEQQQVLETIINSEDNIFVTGVAGTGKSTVLRELAAITKWVVTAATGVAAVNIGGLTLHSYLGIGIATESAYELGKKVLKYSHKKWQIKTIIIDEISMLDAELMDKLSEIARFVRNSTLPFGGMRVIMFGDFLQLPPVSNNAKFAFESAFWRESKVRTINLKTVYRQVDNDFVSILSAIRVGTKFDKLPVRTSASNVDILKLRSTNAEVDAINASALEKLPGNISTFNSTDKGDITKLKDMIVPDRLELKIGAKVMLLYNLNVAKGLCNGSIGKIVSFSLDNNSISVDFGTGIIGIVKQSFEIKISGMTIAERIQFPLRIAYAITIHKSQGLSLTEADIDVSNCFSPGQVYVALSRVRSPDGLWLTGFNASKIRADPRAIMFTNSYSGAKVKIEEEDW